MQNRALPEHSAEERSGRQCLVFVPVEKNRYAVAKPAHIFLCILLHIREKIKVKIAQQLQQDKKQNNQLAKFLTFLL
jgi:replicative superfamily II helicase